MQPEQSEMPQSPPTDTNLTEQALPPINATTQTLSSLDHVQLTSNITYVVRMKGWHKGTLSLVDDTLTLVGEDGSTLFQYNIRDIAKVISNKSIYLVIYTNDKKIHSVSFANVLAYTAASLGGIVGTVIDMRMEKKAQSAMQDWLNYFDSKGLLKRRMSLNKVRIFSAFGALILIIVIAIIMTALSQ